ncbi:putative F-box protein At3g16210 [Medicago truncatula]|uniref:F-box protein interaction domain protein n=1 Tax=Medicago truncatula TaxID=3880 RepID=A0A072UID2_MEDTR|nr:putative F-box protein At3g16210 [Medicago truncatula]KEH28843.1 F-box protein interaction domain protein [Medicago truncatula]
MVSVCMQLKESMALTKKVSNHIPHDLSFDIVSKLPLKSLKRFTCVCKFWANLFENPQFMSVYRNNFFLSRSRYDDHQNSRLLLKVTPAYGYGRVDKMFLLSGDTFENSVKLDWPPLFEEDSKAIFIVGSVVNGILCLCQGDIEEDDDPSDESVWQIYSLKSNSWRDLEVEMPNHTWTDQWQNAGKSVYCQGMCHWWGYEDYDGDEVLVSFNLSDEVFITTPFNYNWGRFFKHMVVLKEFIAMIEYEDDPFYFFISILGEIGVAESWTRLFKIGPLYGVEEPIGVGKNADIFYMKKDEEVARFDLNTEVIEDIRVKGRYKCCQTVIYNESLLPIEGMHG